VLGAGPGNELVLVVDEVTPEVVPEPNALSLSCLRCSLYINVSLIAFQREMISYCSASPTPPTPTAASRPK